MSILSWLFKPKKEINKLRNQGKALEDKVAKAVGKKVPIESRNKVYYKNGKRYTETDIETRTCAIEVKSGKKGRGLEKQLNKYAETTGKETIAYAPKIPTYKKEEVKKQGFRIFSKLKDLTSYVRKKEKLKGRKK